MGDGDGMSMAEFNYPMFQAYDWWYMYTSTAQVQLQIGGSDQYGNICAGIDAVSHLRKITKAETGKVEEGPRADIYGLTTPLLTTASGEKFGKSAGNAVWLDKSMMSSFDLYQVRTLSDRRALPVFTDHNSTFYEHQMMMLSDT
jgi:tyrosyl-tRNA synthetase